MTRSRESAASPYQLRLLGIAALMLAVSSVLATRTAWLTLEQGEAHREEALKAMRSSRLLATWRGRILDARDRELAVDRAGTALALSFPMITGDWETRQARLAARDRIGRTRWDRIPETARETLAERERPRFGAIRAALFEGVAQAGGLSVTELMRRLEEIRAMVEGRAEAVWAARERRARAELSPEELASYVPDRQPIGKQLQAHVVIEDVTEEQAFRLRVFAEELGVADEVEVADARRRARPHARLAVEVDGATLPPPIRFQGRRTLVVEDVAGTIVGDLRGVWAEDVETRPYRRADGEIDLGGYLAERDTVGATGLERRYESRLRGLRGRVVREHDTGRVEREPPRPGEDLQTTIDGRLQARLRALLQPEVGLSRIQPWHRNAISSLGGDGLPLAAAVVVLEIDSGAVRALVSTPTGADLESGRWDVADPRFAAIAPIAVDRATDAVTAPGSIVKPLVLCRAEQLGRADLQRAITCNGHYFEGQPETCRCWIYREAYAFATHGPLGPSEAVARSCNIFFYTLADRLGPHRLETLYRDLGVGTRPALGLGVRRTVTHPDGRTVEAWVGEHPGVAPDGAEVAALPYAASATVMLGIGQGPVAWSPLHAANAYATLARGGRALDPTIGAAFQRDEPQQVHDLGFRRGAVAAAMEGLRRSVRDQIGTGHHINLGDGADYEAVPIWTVREVDVWGKTGTAQEYAWIGTGDERRRYTLTHAWFVGLVGPGGSDRPLFAISVLVPWGGSGGRVAAPIANQVIHALQDEGWLPGGREDGPPRAWRLEPDEVAP